MENRVKTRLSRIFQGSLNSCKTKHLLDAVEKAVLIPQSDHPPSHAFSTKVVAKPSPLPSLCRPRHYRREKTKPINGVTSSIVPRRKLYSFLAEEGFQCPPASPPSPFLNPFYSSLPKTTSRKKKERKRSQEANYVFRSYSQDSAYYNNWFSSEEEDRNEQALEEENDSVFFSSKSNTVSSDSSGSNMAASKRHRPGKGRRRRRRRASTTTTTTTTSSSVSSSCSSRTSSNHKGKDVNVKPLTGDLGPDDQSSVKDSFAVVKSSSDPRNDFMTSMVEMIIEKQIFGADELEYLLRCFLSLNSDNHHGIIVQVFEEICEALFSS